ncbi:MAG: 3'-5' exonuclease [Spirochaetales bacterium]|uniref:ATP-dependent helicase n=1 Tax=Bullifex sp. TaxID=2815808 RepID=UPI002A581B99|nr:UvrD-helicase domain-containing protein [Bullifex sp.]MDD7271407.1 3'-5' exonuclease [Spirochaetales bacterium]MDY4067802.1 3'-5' exonuclease [Bullifex sp.]
MSIDLVKELNSEQAKAAANINGPSLIIAGAGSGKTRMLTYRIAYMLEEGINDKEILALTFTNKAAKEMKERINALTKNKYKHITATTFHSFGLGLLKQYIQHLGYKNNFTVYDTNDNTSLLRNVIVSLGYELSNYNINSLLQLFSDIKCERHKAIEKKDSALDEIYKEFVATQKAYNVVDFDDLILLPIKIFEKCPDVLNAVQERFKYILVDEFQDTSLLQYKFVTMIAKKYQNIAVVGDDDQSIYSWRGANYQNIVNFEHDFPSLKEFKLERNYRCSGNILEAANTIITHNEKRKEKKLWTEDSKGSQIYVTSNEDEEEEAYYIAQQIKDRSRKECLAYSDFAVLVRTNTLLSKLETALMENSIPTQVSGGQSFFDRKEIRDLLCYLKVIVNIDDDVSLLRIINTPRRGIGRVTIEKLRQWADKKKTTLFDAISDFAYAQDAPINSKTQEALKNFVQMIITWQNLAENNQKANLLSTIIDDISYREKLHEDYPESPKTVDYKMQSLEFLRQRISRYEKSNPDTSLRDYLNLVMILGEENSDVEKGKVNLMTMHAAKGLEFNTVYLAGIEDNIIPSSRALEENPQNIEEERRLFYVAVTRAKKELTITYCENRKDRMGENHLCLPSRFIEEIPSSLISNKVAGEEESSTEDKLAALSAMLEKFRKK